MNRNMETIYDALSRALTDYEGNGEEGLGKDARALYEAVVDIVNDIAEMEG